MYELLIEQLRTCSCTSTCETCPYGYEHCEDNLIKNAADAIAELQKDLERSKDFEAFWQKEAEEALRKFQVAIAQKPHWIPVTERLPEVDKNVLVFACGNEITIGRMKRQTENGYHVFIICHGIARELARPGRITHWMPLPEPPKEET